MKRLRAVEGPSPVLDQARALLDAIEPLPESETRMRRVRLALDRPHATSLRRLPALVMAGILALVGASAFAAVRLFVTAPELSAPPDAAPAAPRPKAPPVRRVPVEEPGAQVMQDALAPASPAANERASSLEEPRRMVTRKAGPAGTANEPAEGMTDAIAPLDPGSALVHEAVKALRRDRDPARAAHLLAEHRARTPSGPLAEEVLALQIEAALAMQDARALGFAREYLARHPNGRYLHVARQALAGTTP